MFSKWSIKDTTPFLLKFGWSYIGDIPTIFPNNFSNNWTISTKLEFLLF